MWKSEKDGAMTLAHRETNVPLFIDIQVWEHGARTNNGVWAGQLGDRRAISTPGADVFQSSCLSRPDPDTVYEFQLKGAGRTPFSLSTDGLAGLRSSIPIHVLGIFVGPYESLESEASSAFLSSTMSISMPATHD
ncbi:hypothetical protein EDD15DRAFT_2441349 [Pisolithus albus]|nr:hypothetical protein EDD15DRAFT_2441349 [Pisolithus albus]